MQARSISEALKAEVHLCLAGVGRYAHSDTAGAVLSAACDKLERDASPLLAHTVDLTPLDCPLPRARRAVVSAASVTDQVTRYYIPRAMDASHRQRRLRRAEVGLAAAAALLAAASTTFTIAVLAAWVGVVTTVAGAVTAHASAQRYQFLLTEYL